MDNRPIGIFDSGLGGLTALKMFQQLMPEENIIYFADTGRVPYGDKTAAQLRRMVVQDMDFLAGHGVKAMIAACGTVSSTAPDLLRGYRLPVVGVLDISVRALAETPGDAPLGVIATAASISSGAYQRELARLAPGRVCLAVPCPDFVPLIESGHSAADDPLVRQAVEKHLKPLKETGVCAILLGCTHFGIIGEAISAYMGAQVRLVSAAECAAGGLSRLLKQRQLCGSGRGSVEYYTSGSPEEFARLAAALLGENPACPVQAVPVMEV